MAKQRNPKNPVSNFYWNDWLNDPALKICSYAAKGLWMDLLSLAATCVPFGHLSIEARPLSVGDLAEILPGRHTVEEIAALLTELLDKGVASRTAKGVIYSRRMVRDAHKSKEGQKNGKKGGNPSLSKQYENSREDNLGVNPRDNPNTFSSSSITPKPPPHKKRATSEEGSSEDPPWTCRVSGFFKRGFWQRGDWGPPPGEPGCRAPVEVVEAVKTSFGK